VENNGPAFSLQAVRMPIVSLKDVNKDDDGDGSIPAHAQGKPVDGEKLSKWFGGPGGIYHEKQIGSLCAVHCINNLLQNGMFNEIQLGEVAIGLDSQERAAMGGSSLEGESANVRADGFFSSQVIFAALQNAGLTCTPIGSEHAKEALSDPAYETAFICNRSEHWFSIRKVSARVVSFSAYLFAQMTYLYSAARQLLV
jgi:hypothetical protein